PRAVASPRRPRVCRRNLGQGRAAVPPDHPAVIPRRYDGPPSETPLVGATPARVPMLAEGEIPAMFQGKLKGVAVGVAAVMMLGPGLGASWRFALAGPGGAGREKAGGTPLVRSARGGPWSAPATWEGGRVPGAGARVQVRAGHAVTYDLKS